METTAKATERLCLELMKGNVGRAIAEMETYLTAWPQQQTRERLSAIKEDGHLSPSECFFVPDRYL